MWLSSINVHCSRIRGDNSSREFHRVNGVMLLYTYTSPFPLQVKYSICVICSDVQFHLLLWLWTSIRTCLWVHM